MPKTETIFSGIISGIIAFWLAYHVERLFLGPFLAWLVYSLGSIPAPPGVFTLGEILRVGLRLPTPDTWFALILMGSLAGTLALPASDEVVHWQRIRKRLQKLFWVCASALLLLLVGLSIVEWAVTKRLYLVFELVNLLTTIAWMGLGLWLVYQLEKVRDFVMQRWLG